MREAIGSSLIFNLVITFVIILMAILVGSFAYSKAYKAKNIIINTIVKHDGWDDLAKDEANASLSSMGYQLWNNNCKTGDENMTLIYGDNFTDSYNYCVYEVSLDNGVYYRVVTYMRFDFPIIGNFINLPVQGETRILKYNFDNIKVEG